ncbi:putative GINS DNA replication complex subunit Sld5 [Talaromyces proteolyticus]|uniref:DNA replication complex GINS protein SLD5 n=1 Tax=Talaromyces proteolyticus TaxID=1131652 RepID=A0AAD4L0W2_9EURO|nr:putative GINS DNA replication complex subunit Sld5 [Talaromyces proteolyticus]KAH8705528.1 putative GINS DNA replication complex subunit Sld5 [Talaromyces proteolyticus]
MASMDIDDILASVDRDNFTSPESTALDHQQLTRLWIAERAVSEVLPWPGPLMERMMERVRRQVETIEDLTASSYDDSSLQKQNQNQTLNLKLSILQTDLSRTQFLIRSFLRQRIAKLTKFAMYYLMRISPKPSSTPSQPQSSNTSSNNSNNSNIRTQDTIPNPTTPATTDPAPLSTDEARFLYSHQYLLASHYGASFLASFPPQLRRLDDNAGGTSMVQGPDTKEVVFVRVLVDEVTVVVPADDTLNEETYGTTMRIGEVWVARWEGVRKAWERGEVEVL